MFLKNAWYVAAWSTEVTSDLQQIKVLGEKICIYRTADNQVVALEDACPHRKLPLSKGRIKNGGIECGYHGLTFNGQGQCVWAPGDGNIPPQAKVHAYPLHEKYDLVWIWMGDSERADPADIIEIPNFDNPAWGVNQGAAMELHCNYLLMCDNLLDPSHVAWVHQSSFAQAAAKEVPLEVTQTGEGYIVHRWMLGAEPAPFYKKIVEFEGHCDRLQHYEVRYPAHALIRAVFTPAGTGGVDGPLHENTFVMDSYNFMTPTAESETRYYWFQLRNIRPEDQALSQMMSDDVQHAFEEDRVILNAIQIGLTEKNSPTIDLSIDSGSLRFRSELADMIAAEEAGESANAASVPDTVETQSPNNAPESIANLAHITNPAAWAITQQQSTANQPVENSANTKRSVYFSDAELAVEWTDEDSSLLELAERHGLFPDFVCRSGICSTCKHTLLDGEVEYFVEPLESLAADEVLLCCSRPVGRVVIDL